MLFLSDINELRNYFIDCMKANVIKFNPKIYNDHFSLNFASKVLQNV